MLSTFEQLGWSATRMSEESENVTGLIFEVCSRTQTPISSSLFSGLVVDSALSYVVDVNPVTGLLFLFHSWANHGKNGK